MSAPAVIDSFTGKYRFLSNFEHAPIRIRIDKMDLQGDSVEHLYQALKATNAKDRMKILSCGQPGAAKRWGSKIKCRPDWEEKKVGFMRALVLAKFQQNPRLAQRLLDTGNAELVEGNWWGDRFWGVCRGLGENQLGRILMWVRAELRRRRPQEPAVDGAVAVEGEGEVELGGERLTSEVTTPLAADSASAPQFTGPFARLDQWVEDTKLFSAPWQWIKDDGFRESCQIPGVVDEVIRRLEAGDYSWQYFSLLARMTNYTPVREENRGYVSKMAADWVEWYRNKEDPSWWSERKSAQPSEQASG